MDLTGIKKGIFKYKYVWIVLIAGMILMLIPAQPAEKVVIQEQAERLEMESDLEKRLEEMLCALHGAGQVKVMLSVSQGEQTIYQTDSTYSQGENNADSRTQTIVITDSDRNETGLVHQRNPPKYLGAIILSQGADDPGVKLAIVEAVGDVTGLGADKISVLKMQ